MYKVGKVVTKEWRKVKSAETGIFISTAFSGAIVVGLSEIAVPSSHPTYRSKSFQ